MSNSTKCSICGGTKDEHGTSQHMFTTNPGELITREQYEKLPKKLPLPPRSDPLGRLLEVLVVKGYIDLPEVLYISDLGNRPPSLGVSNGNGS